MKLYGDARSGNCYKIQLLLALIDRPCTWVPVDIMNGETQTAAFLTKNPAGKIPLLELDDGRYLSESNAIINYLAAGTSYLPSDIFTLAKLQQWQFFEQYSHEPYIAVARFINKYLGLPENRKADYAAKQLGGYKALAIMAAQLKKTPFLVGEHCTTADIALFGYTPVAHEGGFDLNQYPSIQAWIKRVQALPRFMPMASS